MPRSSILFVCGQFFGLSRCLRCDQKMKNQIEGVYVLKKIRCKSENTKCLETFFQIVFVSIALSFASGCARLQVSVRDDKKPLNTSVPKFTHPMLVFAPPSTVAGKARGDSSDIDEYPLSSGLRTSLRNNCNIVLTDSYEDLAKWCHGFSESATLYNFGMVDRDLRADPGSFVGGVSLTVTAMTLFMAPACLPYEFRWDHHLFYSTNQGGDFTEATNKGKARRYRADGEVLVAGIFPIPKYRKYKKTGTEDEWLMTDQANADYRIPYLKHLIGELHPIMEKNEPKKLSDKGFSKLFQTVFGETYDPNMTYKLRVHRLSPKQFEAIVTTPGIRQKKYGGTYTYRPGHLYVEELELSITTSSYGNTTSVTTMTSSQTYDLGDPRPLAPVLSAWMEEKEIRGR